jgi:putative transposase
MKQINLFRNTSGIPIWQRNYYDHIIRNEDALNKIREYIQNNPLRWHFDRENPERIAIDRLEKEMFRN